MACPKKNGKQKRKRLPSINPFFHFLKVKITEKMWKKYKGCKKSAVVEMAARKWQCMSQCEKQPYYNAACKAQRLLRKMKKNCSQQPKKPKCPKKPKPKCPKKSPKKKKPVCCPPPCPPCP